MSTEAIVVSTVQITVQTTVHDHAAGARAVRPFRSSSSRLLALARRWACMHPSIPWQPVWQGLLIVCFGRRPVSQSGTGPQTCCIDSVAGLFYAATSQRNRNTKYSPPTHTKHANHAQQTHSRSRCSLRARHPRREDTPSVMPRAAHLGRRSWLAATDRPSASASTSCAAEETRSTARCVGRTTGGRENRWVFPGRPRCLFSVRVVARCWMTP
eukprot:scaffold19417_cov56-Phaeocystis_antarctica.AAC.2